MVSNEEMWSFLGVLLLTGYHNLQEKHHYWLKQPDLGVPAVYNITSTNSVRYTVILATRYF